MPLSTPTSSVSNIVRHLLAESPRYSRSPAVNQPSPVVGNRHLRLSGWPSRSQTPETPRSPSPAATATGATAPGVNALTTLVLDIPDIPDHAVPIAVDSPVLPLQLPPPLPGTVTVHYQHLEFLGLLLGDPVTPPTPAIGHWSPLLHHAPGSEPPSPKRLCVRASSPTQQRLTGRLLVNASTQTSHYRIPPFCDLRVDPTAPVLPRLAPTPGAFLL